MNTGGKDDVKLQNKIATTKLLKPSSSAVQQKSKFTATGNGNAIVKSKSTVTKITKLVLKPKPTAANTSLASKVTTAKYITKPVAAKSRATIVSHENTFQIKNIKKQPTLNTRSVTSAQNPTELENNCDKNETIVINKSSEMIDPNITSTVEVPILQEITAAVVNTSHVKKGSVSQVNAPMSLKKNVKSPKKTGTNLENEDESKPKYDPIKVREFIRLQKEKRKEADEEEAKQPSSKEQIKQRLSALRQNTMKIVEKNVQKARNVKSDTFKPKVTTANAFTPKIKPQPKQVEILKASVGTQKANQCQTPQTLDQARKITSLALTPSKFLPSIKSDKMRIGILRRPEGTSPNSNESPTFIDQTPTLRSQNNETQANDRLNARHHRRKSSPSSTPKKPIQSGSDSKRKVIELELPETRPLKSTFLEQINHKCDQIEENKEQDDATQLGGIRKPKDIPYWLRPTPVQPYPYNFIMAIRKKLESIAHPIVSVKQPKWPIAVEQHTPPSIHHSPIARPSTHFESQCPFNVDKEQNASDTSDHSQSNEVSAVKTNHNHSTNHEQFSEQEEYSMNFYSNASESKRNRSSASSKSKRRSGSQDTLSISSGILSQSSPEKKLKTTKSTTDPPNATQDEELRPPSPLTTDYVDGLQITSRSNLSQNERNSHESSVVSRQSIKSTISSHINYRRGKDYSVSTQSSLAKLSKQQSVSELLEDFKSSLSQAIQVNQKLHHLLANPPAMYRDNFELTSKQNVISEQFVGTRDSTSVPSYQSQYSTNGTQSKPSSNSTKAIDTENGITERSTATRTVGSNVESTEMASSKRDQSNETTTRIDEVTPKASSTILEENIDEDQLSESPTNNDLKSISLSIAKKSAATSDNDTDQPSNAVESYSKQVVGDPDVANKSIGDIFAIFNTTSMDPPDDINTSIWSEHNVSYSTLGMCDQLIKSETRKGKDLATVLKLREKLLIDRFKGQIAWLELQKQKLKERGLTAEISMIKKKQRALLLRLNNDRKELHRVMRESQPDEMAKNSNVNFNIRHITTDMSIRRSSISKQSIDVGKTKHAMKAIELPGGGSALEVMLQKRENELRRRRKHVEKLLKWHQRLDVEEHEVMKMEQMIMFISTSDIYQTTSHEQINDTLAITVHHRSERTNCQGDESSHGRSVANFTNTIALEQTRFEHRKQKQIHEIDKSLNTLKMISSRSISSDIEGSHVDEVVHILGRQLNKLWKRLTGEIEEKFIPSKEYKLGKLDLESLYEQAKTVVLKQFHANDEFKRRLIDNSMSHIELINSPQQSETHREPIVESKPDHESPVPALNLASSPEPKGVENSDTDQGYYFSNVEQNSEQPTQAETHNEQAVSKSNSSRIATEERIDDDQSNSLQEDIQSDITEDSLNKPKNSAEVSPSEIKTASQINESDSGEASQIPSVVEMSQTSVAFELNFSNNSAPLIEETSFPNIDLQVTMASAVDTDVSTGSHDSVSPVKSGTRTVSSHMSEEQKYSDDFEYAKYSNELTSISTATVTKTTTPTTVTPTAIATENSQSRSPSELEQRLMLIDDGLKELSEAISQSPILHSDGDSKESEIGEGTTTNSSDDNEAKTVADSQSRIGEDISDKTTEDGSTESETKSSTTENKATISSADTAKADSDESSDSIAAEIAASKVDNRVHPDSPPLPPHKRQFQYTISVSSIDYNKVPEADALKRSQVPLETELKLAEQSSSMFPFLRDIPKKPPPPYPVHRHLPKTAPFPSDDRIKEIVYGRVEELYNKTQSDATPETPIRNDATFVKSPTLPLITSPESPLMQGEANVFERIIFDCCEEIMQDANDEVIGSFKQRMEFFNPPNRLACLQQHTFKRIFKLLNRPHSSKTEELKAFTGTVNIRSFLPSQVAHLTFNNRRKRDAVDEILIHELYEDEPKWTNFELEENEVRESVTDLRTLLADESSEVQDVSANVTNTE